MRDARSRLMSGLAGATLCLFAAAIYGQNTNTTTTTTRSFPGGALGMLAVAVLVLLVLFALFRGRDRTVVRETYASSSTTSPGARNVATGTASDDRMNLTSRAASGTGTTNGGMNDPSARG